MIYNNINNELLEVLSRLNWIHIKKPLENYIIIWIAYGEKATFGIIIQKRK